MKSLVARRTEQPVPENLERAVYSARDQKLLDLRRADPRASLDAADSWLTEVQPASEAEAWARRAHAHGLRAMGEYPAALAEYELAEKLFDRLGLEDESARTAASHVWALRYLGRYHEAVERAIAARDYFKARGQTLEVARVNINLGPVYRRMGRLEAARRAYVQAGRDCRSEGDATLEATALSNLGNVLADMGRYDEAERAQRRAVRLYWRTGQHAQEARGKQNLGLLLKQRGDYAAALTALQESRRINERLGLVTGLAFTDLYLAQTYLTLNLLDEAAAAAARAKEGFEKVDSPYELAQALLWAAGAAQRRGETDDAARWLAQSVDLFRQTGNKLWEAVAQVLAASVSTPDEAIWASVSEAEQRLVRLGARERATEAKLVQGDLLRSRGSEQQALARYRAAERAARSLGDDHLRYRARAAIGGSLAASRPGRALTHYRAAIDHLESLRQRARADDLKLSVVADKVDVYEHAVSLLLRTGRVQERVSEALTTVERGKSLGLLDDLMAQGARGTRETAALARRLRDIRAQTAQAFARRDESKGAGEPTEKGALEQLEQQVATATRDLQLARRGDAAVAPFELAALRAALPPKAILIEYYNLGPEMICFVVEQDRLRLHRGLGSVSDVHRLGDRLRFQFGKGIYGAAYLEANLPVLRRGLDRVLVDLWRTLLQPLEIDLESASQVIVVPQGPIHGLPLHAAFDGQSYVAEHLAVTYAPSARVFAACTEREIGPAGRPLFVGPRDERLPWAAREVKALATLFPAGQQLAGRRATVAGLRRRAAQFDLLHLAAHGLFRSDNPQFSAIRLSDGWLSVGDLAELCRGVTLVTLSACETGLNSVAAGDELLGLSRAVLGSGAASLLASLWTVHDESTSHFMTRFYGDLQKGLNKTASLQNAMWTVRQRYDHPYFWAPFALAGAV